MSETIVRRMRLKDLDEVAALEKATFARPWSRESFRQELTRNVAARYLVAEEDGRVIGYAGAWIILDESHITNIAVAEDARGRGVGRKLTEELLRILSNLGASYATLEVRVSNLRAQNLYSSPSRRVVSNISILLSCTLKCLYFILLLKKIVNII